MRKFTYSFLIIEGFWAWGTNALLILFLGWLPLLLGKGDFGSTMLAYNLPYITRNLMTISMVGLFSCVIIDTLLVPFPKNTRFSKKLSVVAQWLFFPIGMIVLGSLPSIEAQTRLMLDKRLGFWVTEKGRYKKNSI